MLPGKDGLLLRFVFIHKFIPTFLDRLKPLGDRGMIFVSQVSGYLFLCIAILPHMEDRRIRIVQCFTEGFADDSKHRIIITGRLVNGVVLIVQRASYLPLFCSASTDCKN